MVKVCISDSLIKLYLTKSHSDTVFMYVIYVYIYTENKANTAQRSRIEGSRLDSSPFSVSLSGGVVLNL